MTPPEVTEAFQFALDASEAVRGTTSPNPPVGAVILDANGQVAGVGATAPPGGPHAEVRALAAAGDRARGGTAVVTLEPCNHTGRTGPCARALIDAGIATVYYSVPDPGPVAGGGAETLRAAGITVHPGLGADAVIHGPLRAWLHRARTGRPHVTWKYAETLEARPWRSCACSVCQQIGEALKDHHGHTVVIRSTIMPGTIDGVASHFSCLFSSVLCASRQL